MDFSLKAVASAARPRGVALRGSVARPRGAALRGFRLLHRGLVGVHLRAAWKARPLLHSRYGPVPEERPRRPVIGHVLLHGHARNGAADHVESQVLQLLEADATFTHVELLAALLVFADEPVGESGMAVEAEEVQHHA